MFQGVGGLEPEKILVLGQGVSREEVKDRLFEEGVGFVPQAVTTLQELCGRVLGVSSVLDGPAREEILAGLLEVEDLRPLLPGLVALRRRRGFLARLDRALQRGRMAFGHWDEEEVLAQRLGEGASHREEVRRLGRAYERWLEVTGNWDPPLLVRSATTALEGAHLPQEVLFLEGVGLESLELALLDELGRHCGVTRVLAQGEPSESQWKRAHSLDDACEFLAEELREAREPTLLIPDDPGVRRSLMNALSRHGVELADPRDPTLIKSAEWIKRALLPLRAAASGFGKAHVLALVQGFGGEESWVEELEVQGYRRGGEGLSPGLTSWLVRFEFSGRMTASALGREHVGVLERSGLFSEEQVAFVGSAWDKLHEDTQRFGEGQELRGVTQWWPRFRDRLDRLSPPVARERLRGGVRLVRLGQSPLPIGDRVGDLHVLGLPPSHFEVEGHGDLWFTQRDREILSAEFAVRSGVQEAEDQKRLLRAWMGEAGGTTFWDYAYESSGTEREGLALALEEILGFLPPCEELGGHPRFSYTQGLFEQASPRVELEPVSKDRVTVSTLERVSRCPFTALAKDRWKLEDLRESSVDLWADTKGMILHKAAELLVRENLKTTEAVRRAWLEVPPKGLVNSERLREQTHREMVEVLDVFLAKEREYQDRSGARPFRIEDEEALELEISGVRVRGRADRIDETSEGELFVMDYKTGSQFPQGSEMIEKGYRSQLPFYALASQARFGKRVVGAQFVGLNRKGSRSQGVLFKQYNGKEGLTNSRSRLSVLAMEPEDAWSQALEHLEKQVQTYLAGHLSPNPAKPTECGPCRYADLCGERRRRYGDGVD